jgi:co-chaperonin GroES (HSP10)
MSTLKLRGELVAVTEATETFESSLALPQERNIAYNLGKAVAIGDGKLADRQAEMLVKPGDLLLFQMNGIQATNSLHLCDGQPIFILNQGDMIARLQSTTISLKSFEILGGWVLLEPFLDMKDNIIVIPDTAMTSQTELQKYRLLQQGSTAKLDAVAGQELVVERMRVHRIDIGGDTCGFIHSSCVHGVIEQD